MVVPGGENRHAGTEGAEEGAGFERVVFRAHDRHVGGVGVDVITEEEEQIHRQCERAREHRVIDLLTARAEDDVGDGAGVAGWSGGRGGEDESDKDDGGGEGAADVHATDGDKHAAA